MAAPAFKDDKPLFYQGKPQFGCRCCGAACLFTINSRIRGGNIYGQVDAQAVVYNSNGNNPPGTNEIVFGVSGTVVGVGGTFNGSHTLRIWADALDDADIDVNDITITVISGTICINGVTYSVEMGTTILTGLIPIIEDPGFPGDNSGALDGIVLNMSCGACP